MKVMLINEHKIAGGCEVYVQNLKTLLSDRGHSVECVYINCDKNILENDEYALNLNTSRLMKFFISPFKLLKLKRILRKTSPDCVIINNIFSSPFTILGALRGYKCIRIVHDYSLVCPKGDCITDSGEVCEGYKFRGCFSSCSYHESKLDLLVKLLLMINVTKFEKKIMNIYISPSRRLNDYALANGFNCCNIPNPLNFVNYDNKRTFDKRKYVYIGAVNKNKGIYELLSAFEKFAQNRDVRLEIYGKITTEKDEKNISEYISDKIIYNGYIVHENIRDVLNDAYVLLVPSFWMENYPTTVLEGFANGVLVVGSDRGGIPELLEEGRGICYRFGEDSLLAALNYTEKLTLNDYMDMVNRGKRYLMENNNLNIYYGRIMECLR
ncbi:MAG: glycosyltransferase family 4 protein [Selenomonas sp.]|uniref:glycosyltransferase family 4 protein n=1 Tax=Selenomonas sp. TaxID=2053611 RepID=UPI0025CC3423|nr:glycosyltransferase family 4 protein [Selenomonas sp.]MCR5756872.1 glycosyltransferase family 4 protein [Selenomonas sp.]